MLIPNNDKEVVVISGLQEKLDCKLFLPEDETVKVCQDKNLFYTTLGENGIPVVSFQKIERLDMVDEAFAALPPSEKYWVRPRSGSGSRGATWVFNAEQAKNIKGMWQRNNGVINHINTIVFMYSFSEIFP